MRGMIKYIVTGAVLLLGFSSCNDWLDVQSKVDIKEDEVFNNESGYWDALVGVYSLMTSSNLYGGSLTMTTLDILACNYDIQFGNFETGTYNLSMYNYKSTLTRPRINAIWSEMYNAIANDNNLLQHLDRADPGMFEEDNYNLIRGEALALRAYMHFDLLRLFGKSFAMDPNAEAIPYVTTYGKEQTPRSTVNQVVELALKDLHEAVDCLENDPILISGYKTENIYLLYRQNRMNYLAARALMARIYLYRGTESDRKQALAIADSLIDDQNIVKLLMSNQMSGNRIMSTELFFNLYKDNLVEMYESSFMPAYNSDGSLRLGNKYVQTQKVIGEIFNTAQWGTQKDGRLRYQFEPVGGYYFLKKYDWRTGDVQPAKCRVPMLRLSEMYYISAECTEDIDKAINRLEEIWRARGYGYPGLGITTHEDVMEFIAQEYRREFYGEGQLFFWYKRNNYTSIPNSKVDISNRLEEVYVLPIPEDEENYGK